VSYKIFARPGWRARIAAIQPATGYAITAGFCRMAPEGVAINTTIVHKPITQDTVEQLAQVGDYVVDAAKVLAPGKPDVIVWTCTTGSLMRGYGYDQELVKRIEDATKIPATTTATAVMAAFKKLGIKKICLATPYIDEVNAVEKTFLEDNGFEVLIFKGLQIIPAAEIINVPPYEMYQLAKEVYLPQADGIFISCTGLEVVDIIEPLEHDLGKPVVTSNQASFWHALQIAKVKEPIEGYGRLLREQ